jgi:hypothetical protein
VAFGGLLKHHASILFANFFVSEPMDVLTTPNRLSPLKRMKRALKKQRKDQPTDDDSSSMIDAPQLNLPRVETRLEMHQTNGLFDSLTTDRRAVSNPSAPSPPTDG